MDRVEREADGPRVAVLRPKGGWMRQQLRYLVPAAAAAALVVVVVRYGGMHPVAPTPALDGQVPGQAGMPPVPLSRPPAVPPAIANERLATVTREERDRLADGHGRPSTEAGRDASGPAVPAAGRPAGDRQ
jgi:hypothetical protein